MQSEDAGDRLRNAAFPGRTLLALTGETALLVTFARAEESRAFRRRLRNPEPARRGGPLVLGGWAGSAPVSVAHTGVGRAAAGSAMETLLAQRRWNLVIAAGFAGGLDPRLALGDTVMEEFPSPGPRRIISANEPVETVAGKRALRIQTGALAVDMETETLAESCLAAGVPFVAARAISDPAETDLPVPFHVWFDLARQRPRPARLVAYLACHPRRVRAFFQFVRAISQVSAALAIAVEGCIGSVEQA